MQVRYFPVPAATWAMPWYRSILQCDLRAHTLGRCGRPSTWGSGRWYTVSGSTRQSARSVQLRSHRLRTTHTLHHLSPLHAPAPSDAVVVIRLI